MHTYTLTLKYTLNKHTLRCASRLTFPLYLYSITASLLDPTTLSAQPTMSHTPNKAAGSLARELQAAGVTNVWYPVRPQLDTHTPRKSAWLGKLICE